MAKSINSADGAKVSGKIGPFRTPMCENAVVPDSTINRNLNPSVAANTTRPGISKNSSPIRSPMNGGLVVRY